MTQKLASSKGRLASWDNRYHSLYCAVVNQICSMWSQMEQKSFWSMVSIIIIPTLGSLIAKKGYILKLVNVHTFTTAVVQLMKTA